MIFKIHYSALPSRIDVLPGKSMVVRIFAPVTEIKRRTKSIKVSN